MINKQIHPITRSVRQNLCTIFINILIIISILFPAKLFAKININDELNKLKNIDIYNLNEYKKVDLIINKLIKNNIIIYSNKLLLNDINKDINSIFLLNANNYNPKLNIIDLNNDNKLDLIISINEHRRIVSSCSILVYLNYKNKLNIAFKKEYKTSPVLKNNELPYKLKINKDNNHNILIDLSFLPDYPNNIIIETMKIEYILKKYKYIKL